MKIAEPSRWLPGLPCKLVTTLKMREMAVPPACYCGMQKEINRDADCK